MRSTFSLAALALLLATTAGCREATAQADLAGKWLRFDSSICLTTFKDGAKQEDEKCFEQNAVVGLTRSGHRWIGIECPRNGTTPPNREYSKSENMEETVIGRITCSTEGPQTRLRWAGMVKDFYPRTSLTAMMKTETAISFEADAKNCRLLDYSRTIHQVNSDATLPNGERRPGGIADYKYRLGKALKCRMFDSETDARALELK
jgi:hypothetical protein